MSVLLFFAPHWYAFEPPLGIPYLSGYLKAREVDTDQRDLNLEAQDYFLSEPFLEFCSSEMIKRDKNFQHPTDMINNIDFSKKQLRDTNVSVEQYLNSLFIVEEAFETISACFYPTRISLEEYSMSYNAGSSKSIRKAIFDELHNPYIKFYRECVIPEINPKIDLIGISILGEQQIIPGITLAAMIKTRFSEIRIVIGGGVFTNFTENVEKWGHMFDFFDYIILYEGEETLFRLIKSIENEEDITQINNLIYKNKDNQIVIQRINQIEDPIEISVPCFDGFLLDDYFSPGRVIPFAITRQKCNWNKCAFCVHDTSISNHFQMKNVKKTVEEIRFLKNKYETDTFDLLIENGLDEELVLLFSKELNEQKINIKWRAHFRLQKLIDFKILKESGCYALFCGVESGSDRVLKEMKKGIKVEQYEKSLKYMMEAGIWTRISLIIGFPKETLNDLLQTFKFLIKNKDIIGSIGAGKFVLYKNSGVYREPEKYDIKIIHNEDQDMALRNEYIASDSYYDLNRMINQFNIMVRQNYPDSLVWNKIPGIVLFVFLTRYKSLHEAKCDFSNYKFIGGNNSDVG